MASSMVRASTLPSSSKRRFTFSSNGTSKWLLAFSAGGGSDRGTETYQKQREISRDAEFHGDERHHRGRSRGEREGGRQAEKDAGEWKRNLSSPPSPTFGMGQSCPPSPQTNFPAAHHSGGTSYVAAVSSPRGTTSAVGTPGSTGQGQVQSNYTPVCLWRPCSEPGLPRHRPPTLHLAEPRQLLWRWGVGSGLSPGGRPTAYCLSGKRAAPEWAEALTWVRGFLVLIVSAERLLNLGAGDLAGGGHSRGLDALIM